MTVVCYATVDFRLFPFFANPGRSRKPRRPRKNAHGESDVAGQKMIATVAYPNAVIHRDKIPKDPV